MNAVNLQRKLSSLLREARFPYEAYMRKHQCVFVHVPKTGGTSIRRAMGAGESGRKHLPWYVYYEASQKRFEQYFKFALVRHPEDRLYSAYRYLRDGGNRKGDREIAAYVSNFSSFDAFITQGLSKHTIRNHVLFLPQTFYLCDWNGRLRLDYLARYEHFDNEYQYLKERLKLDKPLPRANPGKNVSARRYRLSNEARQTLGRIYEFDYALLGYQ